MSKRSLRYHMEGRWIRGFGFGELLRLDLEVDLSFWGWTRLSVSRRPESQGSLPLSLEADPLKFHFTTLRTVKLLFWISQFLRKWAWGRGSLVISFWCGSSRLQVGFPTNLSRLQVGFLTNSSRLQVGFRNNSSRLQVGFRNNSSRLQVGFSTIRRDCK